MNSEHSRSPPFIDECESMVIRSRRRTSMGGRYADSRDRDRARDVRLQAAVSARSGVNIIVSTGTWLDAPHLKSLGASDDDIRKLTVDNPRRHFEGSSLSPLYPREFAYILPPLPFAGEGWGEGNDPDIQSKTAKERVH